MKRELGLEWCGGVEALGKFECGHREHPTQNRSKLDFASLTRLTSRACWTTFSHGCAVFSDRKTILVASLWLCCRTSIYHLQVNCLCKLKIQLKDAIRPNSVS
jgi:hypothetical protein